jgi:hypothetical protein
MDGYEVIGDGFRWAADAATGDVGSLAARLAVAGLFAVAGVYKLRHPLIAAAAAARFGAVRHATARVGYALAAAELGTAALLVAWWRPATLAGCVAAAALALAFFVLLTRALLGGERFACHCMSSSEEEISAVTALRALAMAVAATAGAAGVLRGFTLPPATEALQAIGLAAALAGVPLALLTCMRLWRRHKRFMHETDWEWLLLGPQGRAGG